MPKKPENVIIIGAAGRDFHNFNTCYRDNSNYNVVAFTATQIPDIEGRFYPAELAGSLYPDGIPVYAQKDLVRLIQDFEVDHCAFSYSDITYQEVMNVGAMVNTAGSDLVLIAPRKSMITSSKPVIAIGAVRTGCGKSQTSRRIIEYLMDQKLKVVVVRHPMPYGNIVAQKVQRFADIKDLQRHHCTIEEMEEYEPHIVRGNVIYAGVDYEAILREAEIEADIIVWDGGNNDFPFYKPDLMITVTDPHRAGHERNYYPGEITLRMADIVIINKIDTSDFEPICQVRNNIMKINPSAQVVDAASPISVDHPERIRAKRVLVVEDGPTLTHGEMKIGAGTIAAQKYGASECVDPRSFAMGKIRDTIDRYPDIGNLLPAMGYSGQQVRDLGDTIRAIDCDTVVIGTPIDLTRIITIDQPVVKVGYELQEIGQPTLCDLICDFLKSRKLNSKECLCP